MELSGEEKKIQALFSELKATEEQSAPRFAGIWNRAQLKPRRAWAFNPAFVAAAVLVSCAVVSLAVWSRYRQPAPTAPVAQVEAPPAPKDSAVSPTPNQTEAAPTTVPKGKFNPRKQPALRRNSIQLASTRKLTRDAKAISDWQSPTSALLSSSSDELFSSLPQLKENASGLNSFLPSRPN